VSPAKSAPAAAGGEREVIGVPLLFKEGPEDELAGRRAPSSL